MALYALFMHYFLWVGRFLRTDLELRFFYYKSKVESGADWYMLWNILEAG
jgi:hypothetical protein